jgi:protein-tyrosine phosphatase
LSVDKTNFAACLTIGKEFIFSDKLEITEDSKIHIPDLSKIGIKHKKLSLEDGTNNCICKILPEALEFIENNIDKGVFVHCYAGVSRSASIVFAYLLYKKMKPLEAFELLTSKRPKVLPYESFIKEILDYFNMAAIST